MLTLISDPKTDPINYTEFQIVAPLGTANIVVQDGGEFWGIHYTSGGDEGICRFLGQHPVREDAECMGRMIARAVELALSEVRPHE